MSYRKVQVGGKDYEYVVGRTHVKIKGVGVFLKEQVGSLKEKIEYCECCGERMSELYSSYRNNPPMQLRVQPGDVAKFIKEKTK